MPIEVVHLGEATDAQKAEAEDSLPERVVGWQRVVYWWRKGNLRLMRGYAILDDDAGQGAVVSKTRP